MENVTAIAEIMNAPEITVAEENEFQLLHNRIAREHNEMESSMITIFGALAIISEKKLHKSAGYKSVREYVTTEHGMEISAGQLSDAINTFKAFGDMQTGYLQEGWKEYSFSQLKLMRKLRAEDLLECSPNISTRELQSMINRYKEIEEKAEDLEVEETVANGTEEFNNSPDRVEESGEVEPYVEWYYSIEELKEVDAGILKQMIIEQFKKENNVHFNLK